MEEIKKRGSDIDLSEKIFVSLMAGVSMSDMQKVSTSEIKSDNT